MSIPHYLDGGADIGDFAAALGASEVPRPGKKWLADTGCGHDLISRRTTRSGNLPITAMASGGIVFQTANGSADAMELADVQALEMEETANPSVLEATPEVLSIGKRCMTKGHSSTWMAGRNPYGARPDSKQVHLKVINFVPYLILGDRLRQPVSPATPCSVDVRFW